MFIIYNLYMPHVPYFFMQFGTTQNQAEQAGISKKEVE